MYAVRPDLAIQELEQGIQEFRETGQELLLAEELLRLLKKEKSYDRWLDLYLQLTYEHPTDGLIARCTRDALRFSSLTGRDCELMNAFEHLNQIPFDCPAREQAQAALHAVHVAQATSQPKPVL
jgi:hypothetical protein